MVSTPMAPKPTKKTQPKTNKRRSSLRRAVARPRKPVAPSGKRKQAGEALRENEELLAKAFHTSPHPIGITELATGRCIEVNEACLQLFGFRREEVIGNTTLSLGIWPKQEDRARLVDRLKSGEPVRDLELNFRTSSGELRHILVSADLVELGGNPCLLTAGNDITGRKRAEEALRVSEERFRTMAEAVPSFLFETDAAGWNIWTSAGWCRFTGQTPEQVAGHGWADALHPDDRAANLDQWLHCMEQGVPFEAKQRLRRVDGGYVWVIARALPVRDGQGTVSRWVGSVTDVDDIVQAEEALRESEQRFRAIYDQTYEFIGLLTPDGTLIDVNHTALAFRGLQRSDVIGKRFWETPWWDLSCELQEKLRSAITKAATGQFVRLQAQHRAQDGAIEEIDFSVTPVMDQTGKVTQIIPEGRRITPLTSAMARLQETQAGLERQVLERTAALTQLTGQLQAEIDERKKVQEVLRARSAELQITLDTAATGLVRNSRDLHYRWVNEAYAKLVGRPVEDIVGRQLSDVLGAEGLAKIRPYIDGVLRGERVEFEAELPITGRELCWLHVVYMPDRDAAGDVIGWVGSITDITERKRAEIALDAVRNRQHLLLTATPVVLYACRATGDYGATFISENVREQLGYSPEDFTANASFWVDHLHPDDRPWVLAELPHLFEQGHHRHEYRFLHQDGTYRWIHDEVRLIRDPAGVPVELVGFQIDSTQRKWVEDELRQNHVQLENLTAKLFQAQDNERRRLAHDLHDDITQRLAALTNDLGNLRLKGSTVGDLDPLYNRAKQLTTDVQCLSHQLYPSILDHLGLEEAVRDHVEEFSARTGLATEVVVRHLPPMIPVTQATCLYRVLQESLQNVSKHANATTVLIWLVKTPQGIGLCVHDDGRGFDHPQETRKPRGLGLTSMAERVEALKGTFRIKTKPGDGTEVHASVPMEAYGASQDEGAEP